MALAAYRNCLRAARIAFQGDERVLTAARDQLRGSFREKASLPLSDPSVAPAIQRAEEVAAFLKSNLVQGVKESEDTYKLRIHEHTERGDNDTIKLAGGKTAKFGAGCCSST